MKEKVIAKTVQPNQKIGYLVIKRIIDVGKNKIGYIYLESVSRYTNIFIYMRQLNVISNKCLIYYVCFCNCY